MADGRTHVEAEFQERKRIVFTARERSSVNVRVNSADGGPVGYTSYEMLLMALANCTLGVVMGHESLAELTVTGCRAVIESTIARAPSRVDSITVRVEVDVEGGDERLQQTLERVADSCPVGNTLKNPPQINVQLVINEGRVPPVAAGTTAV
jgi:uncharacterized OsmC-like protein